jgi:hypothetical protein
VILEREDIAMFWCPPVLANQVLIPLIYKVPRNIALAAESALLSKYSSHSTVCQYRTNAVVVPVMQWHVGTINKRGIPMYIGGGSLEGTKISRIKG